MGREEVLEIEGAEFVATIPKWADDEARLVYVGGTGEVELFLIHPMYPPHILNKETKRFEPKPMHKKDLKSVQTEINWTIRQEFE